MVNLNYKTIDYLQRYREQVLDKSMYDEEEKLNRYFDLGLQEVAVGNYKTITNNSYEKIGKCFLFTNLRAPVAIESDENRLFRGSRKFSRNFLSNFLKYKTKQSRTSLFPN